MKSFSSLIPFHLRCPCTLPDHLSPHGEKVSLSSKERRIAVCTAIAAAILLPVIGGLIAFYCVTHFFKNRLIHKSQSQIPFNIVAKSLEAASGKGLEAEAASKKALKVSESQIRARKDRLGTPNASPAALLEGQTKTKADIEDEIGALVDAFRENRQLLSQDEMGALIDAFGENSAEHKRLFSQQELNALCPSNKQTPFLFHERQSLRAGLCGKHAINNAFGEEVEGADFQQKVTARIEAELGATLSLDDLEDFGTDPAVLQDILKTGKKRVSTKRAKICNLAGIEESKSAAIKNYLQNATWTIIYNDSATAKRIPSKGNAPYPIAAGHFIAARKDDEGQWWIIDSRSERQVDMPLSLLHRDLSLIVPLGADLLTDAP
ncbi:MAG: hypothetical protein K0S07_536 [Chlamydiales bacterium]|jgi:hypothetical protein|nr:hypothetical protein [Chlamydiales bacterium]